MEAGKDHLAVNISDRNAGLREDTRCDTRLARAAREVLFWFLNLIPVFICALCMLSASLCLFHEAILWLTVYVSAALIPSSTRPSVSVFALPTSDQLLIGGCAIRTVNFRSLSAFWF